MQLPILTITGMYDDDQPGALAHYSRYMRAATPDGRARHFLVIGPWDHPGTRTPKAGIQGYEIRSRRASSISRNCTSTGIATRWRPDQNPKFLRKPVAYYVSGAEHWRYADTLEAITAESRPYFLDSSGDALRATVRRRKSRSRPCRPRRAGSLSLRPARFVARQDRVGEQPRFGARSDGIRLANTAQVVYVSAPFEQDQELSGFFRFEAWISIDQPDTDFVVTVAEIGPDGTVTPLSSDIMRARYRESLRFAKAGDRRKSRCATTSMVSPLRRGWSARGAACSWFCRRPIQSGSRRIINSGGVVADETMESSHPVTVQIFHDAKRRSALYVPFAVPAAADAAPAR